MFSEESAISEIYIPALNLNLKFDFFGTDRLIYPPWRDIMLDVVTPVQTLCKNFIALLPLVGLLLTIAHYNICLEKYVSL